MQDVFIPAYKASRNVTFDSKSHLYDCTVKYYKYQKKKCCFSASQRTIIEVNDNNVGLGQSTRYILQGFMCSRSYEKTCITSFRSAYTDIIIIIL